MSITPRIAVSLLTLLVALAVALPAPIARGTDGRVVLSLDKADSDRLLAGMRRYLESTQGIIEGLARSDMKAVAERARKSGAAMVSDVSLSTIVGMPPDFLMASMATHQKFDELADAAKTGMTRLAALDSLGGILATCNACHETYRVSAK
jgi:hypothetical protein